VDTSDIFAVDSPVGVSDDIGDISGAGFSVGELSEGDNVVDEIEPSEDDLAAEEDILGGDGLADFGIADE
jgi:hypothetical protein